ncbi:MAG: hypothetical protein JXA09_09525 [Anaerolineae bacterium]|nr:hypothetical protein [Anaerolineae bacterium]
MQQVTRGDDESAQFAFDPEHSVLERDPDRLARYVHMLEEALGDGARVVGLLEIGSYAKGEAVPSSDVDTRAYVTAPDAYLFNDFGGLDQPQLEAFLAACGALPRRERSWAEFNDPVRACISAVLSCAVEFGYVDARYAAFEFSRLDRAFSVEHTLLFQSNVLYDPDGFLRGWRDRLRGAIYAPLVDAYREQYLDRPYRRVYDGLAASEWDDDKLAQSEQVIWVQRAVRCLRNAVASKTYAVGGTFCYKKDDVLAFYARHLPPDLPFVQQVYAWKTDPAQRQALVRAFRQDSEACFRLFRSHMPQLEAVVARVKALPAGALAGEVYAA